MVGSIVGRSSRVPYMREGTDDDLQEIPRDFDRDKTVREKNKIINKYLYVTPRVSTNSDIAYNIMRSSHTVTALHVKYLIITVVCTRSRD